MNPPNNPVVNAGLLYVNGLQIVNTTYAAFVSTLSMVQGAARDSTNTNDIILSSNIILDITKLGANGLDKGVVAPSTFYAVYVIGDSTDNHPTAGLFSLATNSTPQLPYGYDMYRRVGWIFTTGSSLIFSFVQSGGNENRTYYYFGPLNVLTAGSATTYTAIDLSSYVPPMTSSSVIPVSEVFLNVSYTPASAAHSVEFNDFTLGGIFANGIVKFGYGVAALQQGSVRVPAQDQQTFYRVAAGDSLTLDVVGYTDFIY